MQGGEYLKRFFPCTSYDETTSWALPAVRSYEKDKPKGSRLRGDSRAHVKGGFFRQFLSKYPESNLMYAKVIHTHDMVNQIRGDKYGKKAAREELWKGEDHSAYWHGKRGGVYLNPTRKAVYSALIAAEKASRQRGVFRSHVSAEDFDLDGRPEYLFHGNELNMYVHRKGGMIFELDYIATPWNYLDTFTRQPEKYDDLLESRSIADPYPRKSFLDHFFASSEKLKDFQTMTYSELGEFLHLPYDAKECRKEHLDLLFSARGKVVTGGKIHPVYIEKRYRMKRGSILVDYSIKNEGPKLLSVCFSPEVNLSFPGIDENCLSLSIQKKAAAAREIPHGEARETGAVGFTAVDKKNSVTIQAEWDTECELWMLPVNAVWLDGEGSHSGYQSTCFLPVWPLSLAQDGIWNASIQLSFSRDK